MPPTGVVESYMLPQVGEGADGTGHWAKVPGQFLSGGNAGKRSSRELGRPDEGVTRACGEESLGEGRKTSVQKDLSEQGTGCI